MKFSLSDIKDVLFLNNVFIVHCVGYAKGIGYLVEECGHLERLAKVITEKPPVSCSSITVGDKPDSYLTGQIGLILVPNNDYSISHASATDAGTTPEERNQAKIDQQCNQRGRNIRLLFNPNSLVVHASSRRRRLSKTLGA